MRTRALTLAILLALPLPPPLPARHIKLSAEDGDTRRVISNAVQLAEGSRRSWVTVTRTGSFTDPRYGRFEITTAMLSQMVRNFDAGVAGQEIFFDVDHKPGDGAAAKILSLKVDAGRLRAQVEWTDFGIEAVNHRGFRYLSAEFHENFIDNEGGKAHGCTLVGAGLTIRPVIKRLDPVTLAVSSDSDHSGPVFVHPGLARQLTESLENSTMNRWQKFIAALRAAGVTLSEGHLAALKVQFDAGARLLAEDADDGDFITQWVTTARALAEAGTGATVQLSITNPTQAADPQAIASEVTRVLAERDAAAATAATTLAARRQIYTDALAAATALSEPTRTQLSEAANLITDSWSEDSVRALATQQLAIGERLESARQLAAIGYRPAGVVHVASVDSSNQVRTLSDAIRVGLAQTGLAHVGNINTTEEDNLPPFVQRALAQYDAEHGVALHHEFEGYQRRLSGGPVNISDTHLPATYQREVIKQSLSDLNVLALVDAAVDPTTAATHTIPFEKRDLSGMVNEGTTYEGQPISYVGVAQDVEFAYIEPTKLALILSNEAIHFSSANPNIDWDAYARSVFSVSRTVQEVLHRRIGNRLLRSSDSFAAVDFTDAATTAGAISGNYKLTQWPLVRPRQIRDLQGTAIGTAQNPLVVKVGGAAIQAFDGSGTQAAGNYFVDNRELYELGVVTVVDQAGAPKAGLVVTVSASRVTNLAKFDLDFDDTKTTKERHLNGLLQAVGNRKARLSEERYVNADCMLMAPTLADSISNASNFEAAGARADASITSTGDLGVIKGLPSWQTNAPKMDMGDSRILLSQRGLMRYRIAKAFALGAPFEVVHPTTGKPVGKKQAYGEEFSTLHVPTPLAGNSTSVLVFSSTARAAL